MITWRREMGRGVMVRRMPAWLRGSARAGGADGPRASRRGGEGVAASRGCRM